MLAPAIERIARRAGRVPRAVTADRGYGEAAVEDALHAIGVRHVVLPRKGKPNAQRREIQNRRVQEDGPMANRLRRPHQLRQTRLRSRPNPHRRPPRRPNLVRARHLRPQPRQDRRTPRMTTRRPTHDPDRRSRGTAPPRTPTTRSQRPRVLQVEVGRAHMAVPPKRNHRGGLVGRERVAKRGPRGGLIRSVASVTLRPSRQRESHWCGSPVRFRHASNPTKTPTKRPTKKPSAQVTASRPRLNWHQEDVGDALTVGAPPKSAPRGVTSTATPFG